MQKREIKSNSKTASSVLGRAAFAAITAVEGLELTAGGRKRISSPSPPEQRRSEVIKAYLDLKVRK